MKLFSKLRWAVVDCLTGDSKIVTKLPFLIGSGQDAHFTPAGPGAFPQHCELNHTPDEGVSLSKLDPEGQMFVNGMEVDFAPLKPREDYSLLVGRNLLMVRGDKDINAWCESLRQDQWVLSAPGAESGEPPAPLLEVCRNAALQAKDPNSIVAPLGARMGFYLFQLAAVLADQIQAAPAAASPPPAPEPRRTPAHTSEAPPPAEFAGLLPTVEIPPGRLTCPVCWLSFGEGSVMHIASHESLRGDPVLGADAMLRFLATRFNDRKQAFDPAGIPCTEIACPHCRTALFPGFVKLPHHIFSIVGDQSAGKSYYLSVLVRMLGNSLIRDFAVRFQDGDPAGNAVLGDMVKSLFGAETPEQAHLAKTVLDGAMYMRVLRQGRIVPMPRPFVFYLETVASRPSRKETPLPRKSQRECAIVFYDNAGEHFQPGRDSIQSPGDQHIASSHGIQFLFDPFNHPGFRKRIAKAGVTDPQLGKPLLDQQEVILAEMRARLVKLLNLSPGLKIETPLAVMVGKCDSWLPLLGGVQLHSPVRSGRLDLDALAHNSEIVRELMNDIAPGIVANAESISSQVLFFPVSSFGHTPVVDIDGHHVPDPRSLQPLMVEWPTLWILSQVEPEMVLTCGGPPSPAGETTPAG